MESQQALAPAITIVALALSAVGLIFSSWLFMRVRRFSRPFDELARAAAEGNVADALQAQVQAVDANRRRIDETLTYTRRLRTQTLNALQGIGYLRYDAFDDIRGQQSYSLCILDAHQNGLIISSIAGRADARSYAKPIERGACDAVISEEETRALELAKESLHEVEEPVVAGV